MQWLTEVPVALVGAHMEMMGRLRAEEALVSTQIVGAGRWLKRESARSNLRDWQRAARSGRPTAAPANLGAVGIKRVTAPRQRREKGHGDPGR